MPSEPERPIEKLLRGCSKARRERAGESWKIPPATRRLWQREVERQFGQPPAAEPSWLRRWISWRWLQPAGALAGFALVIILSWALVSRPSPRRNQPVVALNRAPAGLAEPHPAQMTAADQSLQIALKKEDFERDTKQLVAQNTLTSTERELVKNRQPGAEKDQNGTFLRETLQDQASSAGAPVELAESKPASDSSPGTRLALDAEKSTAFQQRYGLAAGAQMGGNVTAPRTEAKTTRASPASLGVAANEPAPPGAPGAAATSAVTTAWTNTMQYGFFAASQTADTPSREIALLNRRASPALATSSLRTQGQPQILVSFQVEQAGRQLRVIDSDGSVYAGPLLDNNDRYGTVTSVSASAVAPEVSGVKVDALAAPAVVTGTESYFQVVGTNLTSNQRVVFTGTLSGGSNVLATGGIVTVQADRGLKGRMSGAPMNQNSRNYHLSGTVLIDGTQQVHLEAAPAPRPSP
ncbi:MAG TPA: hypothetical protein VFE51_06980 [Verrucomicrobiae bacterium]|nr:hypothetical protein [Verrucomicrobiae bacterium]